MIKYLKDKSSQTTDLLSLPYPWTTKKANFCHTTHLTHALYRCLLNNQVDVICELEWWSWELSEWVKFMKLTGVWMGWIHKVEGYLNGLNSWSSVLFQWVNLMKLRAIQWVEMKLWLFQCVGFLTLRVVSVGCLPEVEVVWLYWIDEAYNCFSR